MEIQGRVRAGEPLTGREALLSTRENRGKIGESRREKRQWRKKRRRNVTVAGADYYCRETLRNKSTQTERGGQKFAGQRDVTIGIVPGSCLGKIKKQGKIHSLQSENETEKVVYDQGHVIRAIKITKGQIILQMPGGEKSAHSNGRNKSAKPSLIKEGRGKSEKPTTRTKGSVDRLWTTRVPPTKQFV